VSRFVADLGNTRLKWGRLGPDGRLIEFLTLPNDDPSAWSDAFVRWRAGECEAHWAIASVNPPIAAQFEAFLKARNTTGITWFRSAADVPVRHSLASPQSTGADRALAVIAALARKPDQQPGLVVSCGTAITVERISPEGNWDGGAIAVGLATAARALNQRTAQLPFVNLESVPTAWGNATESAIAAGVFWGAVGTARELIAQQSEGFPVAPWVVWTGGDAAALAPWVSGMVTCIIPDLVLQGLALVAFKDRVIIHS
jgi:type III pantothenate kinase